MRRRAGTAIVAAATVLLAVSGFSIEAAGEPRLRYVRSAGAPGAGRDLPVIVAAEGRRIYVAAQAGIDGGGDLKAQTRRAIANLRIALAAADAKAADLVRLDVFLLKTEDPETVRKILLESFPADRSPNQMILPVPELSPSGSLVQISGLAVANSRPGRSGVTLLNPPKLPNPHGSTAVSIADSQGLVYLSGQSDNAIGSHEPIMDMAELTRRSMQGLSIALKGGNATFGDVANVVVYVSSLRQLAELQKVYKSYFPAGKVPPTSYVPRATTDGEAPWVEIDAEAVMPPGTPAPSQNEFTTPAGLAASRFYCYVVRAAPGRTVYISTQTSTESRDSLAQTQVIFDRIQHLLQAAGARFADVVKVRTFFIPSGDNYGSINAVRTKLYDPSAPPASTLLGWDAIEVPGAQLQIDAVAVVPGR
jgi:enamine deaminase RidA (YjgF/YER057c/UK114 family)